MPQSSILAWLSKPKGLPESQPAKPSNNEIKKDGLPIPPPSQEDILPTHNSALKAISKTQETTLAEPNRSIPSNVELCACRKEDITHLKQLNSLLLPIPYTEKFYREITEDPLINNITLLALWHDDPTSALGTEKGRLIGAVRCRILNSPPIQDTTKSGPMLYLSTLVLLSPYRNQGIATCMLDAMTKRAVNDHGVTSIGAHVWEANLEGLEWYRRRGFVEVAREEGYYGRLKPQGAVVMQRRIGVMDLVGG